jgi:hypothetical protein
MAYARQVLLSFATDVQARAFDLACEASGTYDLTSAIEKEVSRLVGRQMVDYALADCPVGEDGVLVVAVEDPEERIMDGGGPDDG